MWLSIRCYPPLSSSGFVGFHKPRALFLIADTVHFSAEFQSGLGQKRWQGLTLKVLPDQIRDGKEITAHPTLHQLSQLLVGLADCFQLFAQLSAPTFQIFDQ